jgi:hypothetical protein
MVLRGLSLIGRSSKKGRAMSWSINALGTKEEVAKIITTNANATAEGYKGKPEADDVIACRDRMLALVESLKVPEGEKVDAAGYGSHSTTYPEGAITSASFSVTVKSVP